MLISQGHHVLLHGRNPAKLEATEKSLRAISPGVQIETYVTDLSHMDEVEALAKAVADRHDKLDVLINNAGIFHTPEVITRDGLDVRFAVNTIAPYLLTQRLLPLLGATGRS
jgi:NAD(P)-dependent dehydrogenase (short-subunit alcohol dehydrogenase family)